MPLKAFFFLLRNPDLANVKAFRSLIFDEQERFRRGSNYYQSIEDKNKVAENDYKSERK
jgi:hypothetical protein